MTPVAYNFCYNACIERKSAQFYFASKVIAFGGDS